jgi:hypothetical protein
MVEVNGLEPMTFPLVKRDALSDSMGSRQHAKKPGGGGERARTDDLLRARQALSQLSYTPILETRY